MNKLPEEAGMKGSSVWELLDGYILDYRCKDAE